jgi:uncharacterized protein YndB with AHSA1/START domain
MSDHAVTHATFTLERTYPVPPDRVFAAWADPELKCRWFAGADSGHQLDFRVGGREINHARHSGAEVSFESLYRDIVADERIVHTSVLSQDGRPATVSLTTVELHAVDGSTRLVLTEQGAFLDGLEQPAWRDRGTGDWLDALGAELGNTIDQGASTRWPSNTFLPLSPSRTSTPHAAGMSDCWAGPRTTALWTLSPSGESPVRGGCRFPATPAEPAPRCSTSPSTTWTHT